MAISNASAGASSSAPPGTAATIELAKNLFALLRDIALASLAVLLLAFPATFNDRLVQAGFEEGSFAGLKWRAKLEESDTGLKEARVQITNLSEQLKLTSGKLKEAEGRLNDPQFNAEVARLTQDSRTVSAAAERVTANVATIISSNANLVDREGPARGNDGQWGVIYGGDAQLAPAVYETEKVAPKLGLPNPTIFMDKNGSYRSVSVVDSNEEARLVLIRAKQRRPDAYIVRMASWCPKRVTRDGYQQCST